MRFVFDIGLWFAANDVEHHTFVIADPEINDSETALDMAVFWAMEVGRDKQSFKVGHWPAHCRRPQNVTSWKLLEVS